MAEEEFNIEISRDETEELLVAWLNELIFIQDTEHVFLVKFEINTLAPPLLKARVMGEKMDREKHNFKSCLKAATFHGLKVEEKDGTWTCQVIFDV
jgi:SHS2 domain-containing protein